MHKPPRRMNSPYTPAGTGSGMNIFKSSPTIVIPKMITISFTYFIFVFLLLSDSVSVFCDLRRLAERQYKMVQPFLRLGTILSPRLHGGNRKKHGKFLELKYFSVYTYLHLNTMAAVILWCGICLSSAFHFCIFIPGR